MDTMIVLKVVAGVIPAVILLMFLCGNMAAFFDALRGDLTTPTSFHDAWKWMGFVVDMRILVLGRAPLAARCAPNDSSKESNNELDSPPTPPKSILEE